MVDLHGEDVGPAGGLGACASRPSHQAITPKRSMPPVCLLPALARKKPRESGHAIGGRIAVKAVEIAIEIVDLDVKRPALQRLGDRHVAGTIALGWVPVPSASL